MIIALEGIDCSGKSTISKEIFNILKEKGNKCILTCEPTKGEIEYDIKVIVYREIPFAQIEALYPVKKENNKDFRYFAYDDAIRYLNEKIKALEPEKEAWAKNLKERLIKTRDRIQHEIKLPD